MPKDDMNREITSCDTPGKEKQWKVFDGLCNAVTWIQTFSIYVPQLHPVS